MNKNVIKKVKAPKGFRFIVRKNFYGNWQVNLYKMNNSRRSLIGTIELQRERTRVYATHSNLETEFHGQGLGTLMYAKAIEWCLLRGYRCKSYGWPSEYAKRVWQGKTLKTFFDIKDKRTPRGKGARTYYAYWKKRK